MLIRAELQLLRDLYSRGRKSANAPPSLGRRVEQLNAYNSIFIKFVKYVILVRTKSATTLA